MMVNAKRPGEAAGGKMPLSAGNHRSAPMNTQEWLAKLTAFDTTSRNSNLACIEEVSGWLRTQGLSPWLAHNPEKTKANLFVTLPAQDGGVTGGIVLSGHIDVVPVDGQTWTSDPFTLAERDGRLYGRGASDMKGFLAAALALVPEFLASPRKKPLHLAMTFDEELGCIGAPYLMPEVQARGIHPEGCIIGEPTGMRPVIAHKGRYVYRCCLRGKAAHSSLTPQGCNAIEYAARLICRIRDLADEIRAQGPFDEFFDVPYTTLSTNLITGGSGENIIPADCELTYEFRNLPGTDPKALQDRILQYIRADLLPAMRRETADADIRIRPTSETPALDAAESAAIIELVRALTGDRETHKVAFGTEGGLFTAIGIPTVICGPGRIEVAHKPDEYVEMDKLADCERFLRKVSASLV